MSVLSVRDLAVTMGAIDVLRGVSFDVGRGERVALIGESGSGKSMTALAIISLLPEGMASTGEVALEGERLTGLSEKAWSRIRGRRIGMIFQEPMTALNPTMRIGKQIAEVLQLHRDESRRTAWRHSVDLLARVEFTNPAEEARRYPHELSGGQRQRVMLAMAIACDPVVILADEPTTALDVTVQAQMLRLMSRLVDEEGAALLLISHDLAVISGICERVMVMYGGRIVETGTADAVLHRPRHPYTAGLRATADAVSLDGACARTALPSIRGHVPGVGQFPGGCPFRSRCPRATKQCETMPPRTAEGGHEVACWHPHEPGPEALAGPLMAKGDPL